MSATLPKRASSKQQRRLRIAILVIGAFVFLTFLFADPLLRGMRRRDQIGAKSETGVAIVVTLVPPRINETGDPMPALATVRYRGHIYAANHVYEVARLKIDAPARIEYRVGKSGTLYLDAVEPLDTKAETHSGDPDTTNPLETDAGKPK
jgi:hypothetical protein